MDHSQAAPNGVWRAQSDHLVGRFVHTATRSQILQIVGSSVLRSTQSRQRSPISNQRRHYPVDHFHLGMVMLSFAPLTQQDILYLIARQRRFVLLGLQTTRTNPLVLSALLDGQGFSCQMDRFLDVPGRRLWKRKLCGVRGM